MKKIKGLAVVSALGLFLFCSILITTASATLIASYPFTGNANDASDNGHHGTVNGATLKGCIFMLEIL